MESPCETRDVDHARRGKEPNTGMTLLPELPAPAGRLVWPKTNCPRTRTGLDRQGRRITETPIGMQRFPTATMCESRPCGLSNQLGRLAR